MEIDRYDQIINTLKMSSATNEVSKPGYCRMWVREAVILLHEKFPNIKIDIMETEIAEEHTHTFLKLTIEGFEPILCDGTGANKSGQFFGYEKNAPECLQRGGKDLFLSNSI